MKCRAVFFDRPVPYAEGVRLQEALHAERLADRMPDTLLILQHQAVVTLGRRGRDGHLRKSPAELAARGIELHLASRGGDVTYHGPGQWVVYPILRLGLNEADAHGHLWNLEEIAVRTCGDFGVRAWRREGMSGAWTEAGKIAAIGFHLKRWVTIHGMSFNVDPDPGGFEVIVPCGLVGERVASLRALLGSRCPTLPEVRERLARNFESVCGRALDILRPSDPLPADLSALHPPPR